MSIQKKFYIIIAIVLVINFGGRFLWNQFLNNQISDFTLGKMAESGKLMGLKNTPVFKSGMFSEDGRFFAYTYQSEIEKPEVNGSVTIRGIAFPVFFQVIDCQSGKKMIDKGFDAGKGNQLDIVWIQDDLVWLKRTEGQTGDFLALYDLNKNQFRFNFHDLENQNSQISWTFSNRILLNNSSQKGLILEANDKRNYRIDPNTGKAELIQGKFKSMNYTSSSDYQVSELTFHSMFKKQNVNGQRESIVSKNGKMISQDDFINAKFLTLSKYKEAATESAIDFYKNYFFILSPMNTDNDLEMELAMLDKNTLKTAWKITLPQNKLNTLIPSYRNERFFLRGDQLLVTNNQFFMVIDLANGHIIQQENLYE